MKRRNMIKQASVLGIGTFFTPALKGLNFSSGEGKKLKIIVTGAHPDDPETGAGGTIKLLCELGHDVILYYLTTGQAGIEGVSHDEASKIRIQEAQEACVLLGAKPIFGNQVDGSTEVTAKKYQEVADFLYREQPDMVFTHWPVDTHRDHRICSSLVYDAWLYADKKFDLFYYEVLTGTQTQNFNPTAFVDISSVITVKHQACFAHKSQFIEKFYPNDHGLMEKFRGLQNQSDYAEAFVVQLHNKLL
jgi:LmbE family N-acetylglucosaminyl deacetylase